MNNLTTFYIVRHGETEYNVKKIVQGHSDSPLTEGGIEQAKKLAQKLKGIKFDYAFSSDLLRAKRTAEIIALEHKLAVETNKLLRERTYGPLEGKPNFLFKDWDGALNKLTHEERNTYRFADGAETNDEVVTRILTFLREIAVRHPGKKIIVVSHGGIIRQFLIRIGFATYERMIHGAVKNGAFVKLDTDGIEFFVKEVSGIQLAN